MVNVSEREKLFRSRSSQAGQALIEYILVLIVVVSIVLGGMYQLSTAFQVWANSYFGDYLSCLLETGELPTLGSSTIVGECQQSYQEFTLAAGRPLVNPGASAEPGDGAGAGENSGGESDEGGRSSVGNAGNAEAATVGGGASGQSRRFRVGRGRDAAGAEESGISRQEKGGGGGSSRYSTGEAGRPKRISVGGGWQGYGRRAKDAEDESQSVKTANVDKGESQKSGPKLIPINRSIAKEDKAPEVDDFTIGSFLRYLVIAAIIIALLIFFGGQILQVSKSME